MTTPVEDSIGAFMLEVLNAVVGTYEQANIELPHKQYIAVGQVAHDCEQVTVTFQEMYLGPPGQQAELPQRCNAPRTVVMEVAVARQLPQPAARSAAPSADAMSDMTMIQMRDAWLLMDSIHSIQNEWSGVIADIHMTQPQGLFQAITMTLVTSVP